MLGNPVQVRYSQAMLGNSNLNDTLTGVDCLRLGVENGRIMALHAQEAKRKPAVNGEAMP